MNRFRLNSIIIIVVGSILCIAAAVVPYLLLIQPTQDEIAKQQARYDKVKDFADETTGPMKIKQAQLALVAAQQTVKTTNAKWNFIQTTKNPPIDLSDRFRAWLQWTGEVEFDFAPRVNAFLTHTGVKTLSTIPPPATVNDPNGVPTGIVQMPLGTISVFGSYDQILNHVASWNRFSRIVLVDGLNLSGYSPFMTGSYSATEFIFTQNNDKIGPPVPSGVTGAQPPKPANFEDTPEYRNSLERAKAAAAAVAAARKKHK